MGCLLPSPYWILSPKPSHAPWPGVQPVTFGEWDDGQPTEHTGQGCIFLHMPWHLPLSVCEELPQFFNSCILFHSLMNLFVGIGYFSNSAIINIQFTLIFVYFYVFLWTKYLKWIVELNRYFRIWWTAKCLIKRWF